MADDFIKDPNSKLDYKFDWDTWLEGDETITNSEFIVSSGLTVESFSSTSRNTTVWLSGGRTGQIYNVTNRIVTSKARIEDRSFKLRVRDR